MNQFVLYQKNALELRLFPHITEVGAVKNSAIRLDGFPCTTADTLKIYYIQDGKFEWIINKRNYTLYPGDVAIIMPGTEFGNENNVLEIGSFYWVHLQMVKAEKWYEACPWSSLSETEIESIRKTLQMNQSPVFKKCQEIGVILKSIQSELTSQEIAYHTRVNHLLDEIFIQSARQFNSLSDTGRNFPGTFMKLEQALRQNLAHQWTVDEMATFTGLCTTLFNERVKNYSGFSPLSYLINIRITEAIKLLKQPNVSLTNIALDVGFYSSQHFSTTFKKLTGYTPSQYRKNYLQKNN